MANKSLSRAERENSILVAFAIAIRNGQPNEMTAYKIARRLGLEPSSHLNNILRGMVASGQLDTYSRPNSGRWTTWFYALPEGSYHAPKKRKIAIKAKGAAVGQLELF